MHIYIWWSYQVNVMYNGRKKRQSFDCVRPNKIDKKNHVGIRINGYVYDLFNGWYGGQVRPELNDI